MNTLNKIQRASSNTTDLFGKDDEEHDDKEDLPSQKKI